MRACFANRFTVVSATEVFQYCGGVFLSTYYMYNIYDLFNILCDIQLRSFFQSSDLLNIFFLNISESNEK